MNKKQEKKKVKESYIKKHITCNMNEKERKKD